ncbi:Response regulator receiver domain-containing protein [Fodinibius salinus]|uniref:Response regulator receiver domain-containing protein n=1 Tax=Fodinibius salinus TaxID=860790 RepID=A0A5D3YMI0_9BACT|nr:response regulator [Fodinibius salinus]TYP93891.1 Response regulator receiver domain-containing protein [Fodinibius salinus]
MADGKVLIVEDDLLLAMVEERMVKRIGFEVVGKAENGPQAIEKTSELEPDVIIMDITLEEGMDGIEAMEEIRTFSDASVIYLSGSSDRYNFERAKKTGFVEFLTKPVTSADVKIPLEKVLGKPSEGSESGENRPANSTT